MNITVSVDEFKNTLQKVSKIASKHLSLPILSCVLIRAEGDSLYISGTNLELGVEISIPAKIEAPGTIAIQADVISNLVSQIQNDSKIKIRVDTDGNLEVSSRMFTSTLHTVPHDDFPSIPSIQNPTGTITIKSNSLIDSCKSVIYSGSMNSIKPELSSILFYIDDSDNLVTVATDLFRLAEKKTQVIKNNNFEKTLVSIKNVLEIIRIISDTKKQVEILVKDNQIVFIVDNIYIISRTVDSNFPDYKQIIPQDFKTEVIVIKNDFLNVLKVSKIFIDKLQHLKFKISPKDNIFTLSLKNSDIGENISHIQSKIEGESLEISFNYKYISDVLQSVTKDSIRLEFNGIGKPVVIKEVGDTSFLYLVMPLVIKNE